MARDAGKLPHLRGTGGGGQGEEHALNYSTAKRGKGRKRKNSVNPFSKQRGFKGRNAA